MKKLQTLALLFVLGTSLVLAQGPRGHKRGGGDMMKKHIERLDSIVDLTDDQKAKIEALNASMKTKMQETRESKDREAMKAIRDQHKKDIEAILTDDQVALLKASKDDRKENMKSMRSELKTYKKENIKPAMKLKRAEFDNELTDDEKATIASLRAEMKELKKSAKAEGVKHKKMDPEKRKEHKAKLDEKLGPIVAAHKTELEKVESDLAPLRATWQADTKAIKEKYAKSCGGDCKGKKGKHKKGRKGKKGDTAESMKYYRFLLMKSE